MSDDGLEEAKTRFDEALDHWSDMRKNALEDLRFGRLGDQWPDTVKQQRERDGRPCLTINKLPSFMRQISNDARMNRPTIRVRPVDSNADPHTAEVFNGCIRHIEANSNADIAYDTAVDCSIGQGVGYFTIDVDYANDSTFDMEIFIRRISNPQSVLFDVHSEAADSADWNYAFVTEEISTSEFKGRFRGAATTDWDPNDSKGWFQEDSVRIAAYWCRDEIQREILLLSNGEVVDAKRFEAVKDLYAESQITVANNRAVKGMKVTHKLMSGAEILETTEWAGQYIPVVPVFGDEFNVDGKRHFRSLIRDAKDIQQNFNYWRPLSLDTPLPTPTGWTTMGAVQIGDDLFDETGRPTKVIGKSPIHINRECYRVEFGDGSHIVADADHPWVVEVRNTSQAYGEPKWLTKTLRTSELRPRKHYINVAKPLECSEAQLPVHPYVFGMWLGDGDSSTARICPGDEDILDVRANIASCGYAVGEIIRSGDKHGSFNIIGLKTTLKAAGLLQNKHIPASYLRASAQQRWALLRGLMDSDGSIHSYLRNCSFTTVNTRLAAGFAELLRSLGIKSASIVRAGRGSKVIGFGGVYQDAIQFSFACYSDEPVFGLKRKADLQRVSKAHVRRTKRHIVRDVVKIDSVPVQCVAIDAPSHLFLAGDAMIPTHNTAATELVALAPKAPWIGEERAFEVEGEAEKWATANTTNHAFLRYKNGTTAPQRQGFADIPVGAVQEAANASGDMEYVLGMHTSLEIPKQQASGRALIQRQKQGDVSTFHFIDNLTRAIRHGGKILVDLIPQVYTGKRIMRILGQDGKPLMASLGQRTPGGPAPIAPPGVSPSNAVANIMGQIKQAMTGAPDAVAPQLPPELTAMLDGIEQVYDLGVGSYDVEAIAGPSFTSRREEASSAILELIQAAPQLAPILADILVKNFDFPDSDKVLERVKQFMAQQQSKDGQPQPTGAPDVVGAAQVQAQAKVATNRENLIAEVLMNREKLAAEAQMNREKLQAQAALDAGKQMSSTAETHSKNATTLANTLLKEHHETDRHTTEQAAGFLKALPPFNPTMTGAPL